MSRLGAKRKPRGLRNSAFPPGEKTRTRCPSMASYSRTLVTASTAPNGCSLEATILPLGAMARSSGLNSGSVTNREGCIDVPGPNVRTMLSPWRSGPIPEARKQPAIMTESKSSRKRYNAGQQEVLYGSIKASRQSNDCTCAAQANEIPAIRAANATAGIQAFNPASVANNEPLRGDRQDAVGPTV